MWRRMVMLIALMGLLLVVSKANPSGGFVLADEPAKKEKPNKEEISPELKTKIGALIKKLGDDDWRTREEATKELIKMGKPVLFPLIDALDSEDPEVRMRTKRILLKLEIEPVRLNEDEVSLIEKRAKEAKGEIKEILQNILRKCRRTVVNGLQATIKSNKKVYKIGEKIIIEFTLTNVSKKDIYIGTKPSGFTTSTICFDKIIGPEGVIKPATLCGSPNKRPPPLGKNDFQLIRPQEPYRKNIVGAANSQAFGVLTGLITLDFYALDKIGKYKITMFYTSNADGTKAGLEVKAWTGKVISNTITIEIKGKRRVDEPKPVVKIDPKRVQALFNLNRGLEKYMRGNFKGAIKDFTQAIEIDPNLAPAYLNRGQAKHKLDDFQGAIEDYNQAIKIDPIFAHAYYQRGHIYYHLKHWPEAIASWEQAIQLNPKFKEELRLFLKDAREKLKE